jgi:VIT1/CCC1 family predicted Fe2+/Mn2+ transporter
MGAAAKRGLIQDKAMRRRPDQSGAMTEHGHSQAEVEARINAPAGRGHLRDMIYGAIDGSITTFAIVAGVAGAGLSPFIIIALGMANVLADGFSMAAGNYSGTKSELDEIKRLRAVEARHIRDHPEGERREIREILRQKGLEGALLEDAVTAIAANQKAWIDLMIESEYGLSAVEPHPMRAALATFGAFLLAGIVPLLPFFLGLDAPFGWSIGLTMAMFFAVGVWKSHWSLAPWWRSGFETFAIGGVAALIAYFVGTLFAV